MMVYKRLAWSIVLSAFGYFVGNSNFVRDLELANPHLPWWDMSGWFYYCVLGFYKFGAQAMVIAGGFVFGLVVVSQFYRFVRFCRKAIWS